MRTTVELKPEHRSRLLALAAERGEKGFSSVLAEAVDAYLRIQQATAGRRRRALRLQGTFTTREAEQLRQHARSLRERWR
jgi:hypothetical protein